jgi:hypothetical protein
MADVMGPQQSFLDWVDWRRRGAKKAERPRSMPKAIPRAWRDAYARLEQTFASKATTKPTVKPADDGAPAPQAPAKRPVTTKTKLLAKSRATQKALESYMLARKHGRYSDDEVRAILASYTTTATEAGLDPLLVVSQMVLETGNLTSHWSQRPRRNPAGIGVTGKPGAGVSFASWDDAVHAHVGRLLAYALPKGRENAAQRALIEEALAVAHRRSRGWREPGRPTRTTRTRSLGSRTRCRRRDVGLVSMTGDKKVACHGDCRRGIAGAHGEGPKETTWPDRRKSPSRPSWCRSGGRSCWGSSSSW